MTNKIILSKYIYKMELRDYKNQIMFFLIKGHNSSTKIKSEFIIIQTKTALATKESVSNRALSTLLSCSHDQH